MSPFGIAYQDFRLFLLIFIRVSVVLFIMPFFSSRIIPVMSKAGLALALSLLLFPVVEQPLRGYPENAWANLQLIAGEFVIGLTLALLVQIVFEGIKIMGQMVGFQTGFGIVNLLDPQSGTQVSVFSNMAYFMTIVIFLLFNGHHILLSAIKESFAIVAPGSVGLGRALSQEIMAKAGKMFLIAVKIGAPAIAALLLSKGVFGIITKLIPQMHIMIVAFPVQIVIGLIFFGICLRVLLRFMENYLHTLGALLTNTLALLGT